MRIKLQVWATAMTYLPLPLPSLAPSIIPGYELIEKLLKLDLKVVSWLLCVKELLECRLML